MHGALAIFQRDAIVFWRELWGQLLTTVAMPLTFLLIFGFGLGGSIRDIEGVPYAIFVIPGLVSMAAVISAFDDASWGLWYHRVVQGTINEYRVNPITTYDIVIGKIFSGFFKAVVKGLVTALVLIAFARHAVEPAHLPAYALFILLGSVVFSCAGTLMGTLADDPETLGRVEGVVVFPLVFLGGVFFPLSAYPDFILPYVRLLPTTAIFDGSREALLAGRVDPMYIAVLAATSMVAFVVAVIVFDRKLSR